MSESIGSIVDRISPVSVVPWRLAPMRRTKPLWGARLAPMAARESRRGRRSHRRATALARRLAREGQDYLPYLYGPVNYTVVDTVEKLPYKVSEIYRRRTG
jgi:hypothetical protein